MIKREKITKIVKKLSPELFGESGKVDSSVITIKYMFSGNLSTLKIDFGTKFHFVNVVLYKELSYPLYL